MLDFVKRAFRGFFVFFLWLSIIIDTIGGGIIGYIIEYETVGAIIGAIIGAIFGVIMVILGGGLVATFLNMDEKLEEVVRKS